MYLYNHLFGNLTNFDLVQEFNYAYPNKEMTPLDIIRFIREKYSESFFFDVKAFQENKNNNKIGESLNKKKYEKKYEKKEEKNIRQKFKIR